MQCHVLALLRASFFALRPPKNKVSKPRFHNKLHRADLSSLPSSAEPVLAQSAIECTSLSCLFSSVRLFLSYRREGCRWVNEGIGVKNMVSKVWKGGLDKWGWEEKMWSEEIGKFFV